VCRKRKGRTYKQTGIEDIELETFFNFPGDFEFFFLGESGKEGGLYEGQREKSSETVKAEFGGDTWMAEETLPASSGSCLTVRRV